jgi:NAD(P)H-nitrite reductase large subunit
LGSDVKRYVIVGNGAAGTTAAELIRRQEPASLVTLITDEPYPLYNRVALPRFVKQLVPEDKVIMRTAAQHSAAGIRFLPCTRVTRVSVEERTLLTEDGQEVPWDRLLVATGGRPNRLPAPGGDAPNVYNFQTLDEAKAINAAIPAAKRGLAVGGSFIAYELTEGFAHRGLCTTWLIRGPRWLRKVLDEDGGELVDQIVRGHGVDIVYGDEVAEVIVKDGLATGVRTVRGRTIEADVVGVGLGLTMNVDFLAGSGVRVERGVVTDRYLQTNVPGVFAAGDVAEFEDVVLGRHNMMGTWDNALAHGRVAALNMMGARQPYIDVPTYQSGLFDTIISVLGMTPENHPELESVASVDLAARNYRKLFFLGERLVGAVLIGSIRGKRQLMDLIRSGQPVPVAERRALAQA